MKRPDATQKMGAIRDNQPKSTRSMTQKSSIGAIVLAILLGIYSFAQPVLNQRFGWDLPAFKADHSAQIADAKDHRADHSELLYDLLREVSPKRYMSPEGLQYTPGSAEGHRLEHLRRHTADIPSRAGSHGVFDGGMEGALETIDKAYERAKKGQWTTKTVDDNRTIYTVDMGGRIGFVGGQNGKRKRNPMARRVRLVLEGNRFITAFPL